MDEGGNDLCSLCNIPKATGDCAHIIERNGQVTMSRKAWERLTDEVARLRTMESEWSDSGRSTKGEPDAR